MCKRFSGSTLMIAVAAAAVRHFDAYPTGIGSGSGKFRCAAGPGAENAVGRT